MSRASEGAAVRAAPASWVIAVVAAFCAVLLLKWLAVVAVVAVLVFVVVRWARGGWDGDVAGVDGQRTAGAQQAPARSSRLPYTVENADVPAPRAPAHDDCTWCGLRGGHRDGHGQRVRPRHAHAA